MSYMHIDIYIYINEFFFCFLSLPFFPFKRLLCRPSRRYKLLTREQNEILVGDDAI